MLILCYESKKKMIESLLGTKESPKQTSRYNMRYSETSLFGEEVTDNCTVTGSNRPSLTHIMVTRVSKNGKLTRKLASEFFASITIKNGIITKIS